jgi:hypothetical protein
MENDKATSQVKFYADTEQGGANKLFTFPVHNYDHAIDILMKFKREGAKIRAAFFQAPGNNFNVKITSKAYDKDEHLHKTFSERKR